MSKSAPGRRDEPDLVAAGFRRLDRKLEARPPKINWGSIYRSKSMPEKIAYLEKLSAAMNHAARLVQDERNHWAKLAASKEQDVINARQALNENNAMIQAEIAKMNAERQQYIETIKKLRTKVRFLERRYPQERGLVSHGSHR